MKKSADDKRPVIQLILETANECLKEPEGINLENKIILSIATRLWAERFMVKAINDSAAVNAIKATQTPALVRMYKGKFPAEAKDFQVLHRVMLMPSLPISRLPPQDSMASANFAFNKD